MERAALILVTLLALARAARAQQPALPPVDTVRVVELRLSDGSTLAGRVVAAADTAFTLLTPAGLRVVVPRRTLESWRVVRGVLVGGRLRRADPNVNRLFFAPTARTLKRGEGYFGDYYLLLPTIGYGLFDRVTIAGGMSVIPGVSLGDQMYFIAPKLALVQTPAFGLAAGVLYAGVGLGHGGGSGGIAYGVTTLGGEDAAVTVGLGWPFVVGEGGTKNPWAMFGGELRGSDRVKLLAEVWRFPGASETPSVFGLRFIGERMSVDFGFMHVFGTDMGSWPFIPWVDFVIHW
jgi:hypothetical protein